MSSNQQIAQFTSVTGALALKAQEYLDRYGGDLAAAIEAYSAAPRLVPSRSQSRGIRTLGDLNNDDDDENTSNNFFTGGEKSALQVEDPNGPDSRREKSLVEQIFEKARQQMGQADDRLSANAEEPEQSSEPSFVGTGFKLGDGSSASEQIEDNNDHGSRHPAKVTRVITFWRQGFTVADGPLHRYDDPENAGVLEELNRGRVPMALLDVEYGQDVDVSVYRKTDEDYQPPKRKIQGFHGLGQRLGSPVPGDGNTLAPLTTAETSAAVSDVTEAPKPSSEGEGDAKVQIRFANGTKVAHRFNSSDLVASVYQFVASHPNTESTREFILTHSFPVKPIENSEEVTVAEAKLKNAVIIQRWK